MDGSTYQYLYFQYVRCKSPYLELLFLNLFSTAIILELTNLEGQEDKMLKVAVCDDEKLVVQQIKDYIISFRLLCVVDTFECGEELVRMHKEYDVIFLDIDMKGINGIKTAQKIRSYDKKVKIIYVTGFNDYRNYAFSVHAFGYLIKPVSQENIHRQLEEVLAYTAEEEPEQMLRFETEDGIHEINVKDIYYFEYVDRKILMRTKAGDLRLHGSITAMSVKMEAYGFYMPHKSFSVNLFYVKTIKGYDIHMMNGSTVPLSQKKSVDFREKLSHYMANRI